MENRPRFSVVVLNWNTRELTLDCLASVVAALEGEPAEVVVVDNGSTDGSADAIADRFPGVTLVRSPENLGFARGMNLGLVHARGGVLIPLNSDTRVGPRSLQHLVDYLDGHPDVGAVGGEQHDGDGRFTVTAHAYPGFKDDLMVATGVLRLGPWLLRRAPSLASRLFVTESGEVDWVSGSCLAVRRELVEDVGPFPEEFFMYGEDIEWCRRMGRHGWKVHYSRGHPIVHLVGRSTQGLLGDDRELALLDAWTVVARRTRPEVSWRVGWLLRAAYGLVLAAKWTTVFTFTRRPEARSNTRILAGTSMRQISLALGLRKAVVTSPLSASSGPAEG